MRRVEHRLAALIGDSGAMRRWLIGCGMIGAGLSWLIVDRILQSAYPQSWGGPNIGGGALSVLAVLVIVGGAVLVFADRPKHSFRHRDRQPPVDADRYGLADPLHRRLRAGALAFDGLLLLGLIATHLLTPGG